MARLDRSPPLAPLQSSSAPPGATTADALDAELRRLEARLTQTFATALEAHTREESTRLEALARRLSDAEERARVLDDQRRGALDQRLADVTRRRDEDAAALAGLGRRLVEIVDEIVELRARVGLALSTLEERKRGAGVW